MYLHLVPFCNICLEHGTDYWNIRSQGCHLSFWHLCTKCSSDCQLCAYPQVNFIKYFDEISSLIGARPNLWHLLMTDPELAFKCFFGPCVPAQYRLVGPGSWQGARDVIMGVEESKVCPLRTRKTGLKETQLERKNSHLLWVLGLVVVVIMFLFVNAIWKVNVRPTL